MNDPPENTKLMDDVVFNEVNHVTDFNFRSGMIFAYFEK